MVAPWDALISLAQPMALVALGALGSLLLWGLYGLPRVRQGFERARVEIPALARREVVKGAEQLLERALKVPESREAQMMGQTIKLGLAHGLDSLAELTEEHPEVLQHPFIAKIEERMEKRVYAAWGNIVKSMKKKAAEGGVPGGQGLGGLSAIPEMAKAFGIDVGPLGDLLGAAEGLAQLGGASGGNGGHGPGVIDLRGA